MQVVSLRFPFPSLPLPSLLLPPLPLREGESQCEHLAIVRGTVTYRLREIDMMMMYDDDDEEEENSTWTMMMMESVCGHNDNRRSVLIQILYTVIAVIFIPL